MKSEQKPLVAVAMSGGVDSSVAAALLQEQGYPLVGMTMRLPESSDLTRSDESASPVTLSPAYITDARLVAEKLGIPHIVVDVRQVFQEQIVSYFCAEYRAGRTPNPCVVCNPQIKFGVLFEYAQKFGAHLLATGHYVQKIYRQETRRYALQRSDHTAKDQSYFLYRLTQEQLAQAIFPLARFAKAAIRQKPGNSIFVMSLKKPIARKIVFLPVNAIKNFSTTIFLQEILFPGRLWIPAARLSENIRVFITIPSVNVADLELLWGRPAMSWRFILKPGLWWSGSTMNCSAANFG
jgi:tRNA-specific 2-thiouridylase